MTALLLLLALEFADVAALIHAESRGRSDAVSARGAILAACLPSSVPCRVALLLAQRESCLHSDLVSKTGAVGLFQLQPYVVGLSRKALFNPWTNARAAMRHIERLRAEHGERWPDWYVCRSATARADKCTAGRRLRGALRWRRSPWNGTRCH